MSFYTVHVSGRKHTVRLISRTAELITFETGGKLYSVSVSAQIATGVPQVQSSFQPASLQQPVPPSPEPTSPEIASGVIVAPMPGKIISVQVTQGQEIAAGETLLVVEAMKMENNITAPMAGIVASLSVTPGQEVESGQQLLLIE